ncbi:NEW3 domain-containing protein [Brevibacillus massiliensis]|uniref:NEW3 domain-containing protein n=1 Tax=Brevibacillus massiliensis TaxID=1118054 RepID=UPI00037B8809|nr:NEW3 domain-containing protein [Brevibacillus massiliensis]
MKRGSWISTSLSLVSSLAIAGGLLFPAAAPPALADRGVVDLWKAIKPLTTIASAMNTGAHPDDEHSATLAYLSLGRGVDTASIIANRGEGGQNEIGSELGNALGIIRTRELQEASKITNVHLGLLSQELNDPIYDFGFSKSPDETLEKWGEEVVYERLIKSIREQRPDVLIPAFLNEPSTHGHHRAISIITVRAYKDAADPHVFPEQLKAGLHPWQVKKLYLPASEKDYTVAVPVGNYDEVYGASYVQLGEESRFMHKSQGMGRQYDDGPKNAYYKLAESVVKAKEKEASLFDGIAYTFHDLAQEVETKAKGQDHNVAKDLRKLQEDADEVMAAYPKFAEVARQVHAMKADVTAAINDVNKSQLDDALKTDLLHRLQVKAGQLDRASAEAASLVVKVKPDTGELVAGQATRITVTAYNGGAVELKKLKVKLNFPAGWTARATGPESFEQLKNSQTASVTYEVNVPANAEKFHPYEPSIVSADVTYEAFGTSAAVHATPENAVGVLPPYAMNLSPNATILNTLKPDQPIPVKVSVRNYAPGASQATISLAVPNGWKAEPASKQLQFSSKGETKSLSFTVTAGSQVANGKYEIQAVAKGAQGQSTENVQVISYPHIGKTYYIQPAKVDIQAFDLKLPENIKIGYVSSGFDNIDQYLREVGLNVVNLEEKDIQFGDLSQYDTIVLGIRAYAFRPELIPSNQRLLDYVKNGGNLVVQYHKPEDKWSPSLAPYPIKIGEPLIEWRVTDENSKVTMLAPDHKIFNQPNKITEADWDNWIQDRAAYNPAEWGREYTALISTGDPGEDEFAGTFLTAPYGRGTYTYSSLVWYREIPSMVPGAIRMFVNMVSLKQ